MRALLVRRAALATACAAAALAVSAPAPSRAATSPPVPPALHPGDAITDDQLYAYLAYPVSPGDWVRYRVVFADRSTIVKTVGFGSESVGGTRTLFIETHVSAQPVTGLPPGSTIGVGTEAVLKTYVSGASFGDLAHAYAVVTSALKVGSFEYEVQPGAGETYSALAGAASAAARAGTIKSVRAVDMRVGRQTLHATHVVASFPSAPLPLGGVALAFTLDVWQSPEAPLGTVAIASEGARTVQWRLVAFGRGDYKSLFSKTLDQIRRSSQPSM